MANRIYLISTKYFKENTTISDNVDDRLLTNAIYEAGEIQLQQAIGTRLYKKLLQLINDAEITLPENEKYKTLLDDYCTGVVTYWAWANVLPYIHFKVMNKGVENQNSENSMPTTLQEMNYIKEEIVNKAEFFTERLIGFLRENYKDYPEYNANFHVDEIRPDGNAYFSGMVFDSDTDNCVRSMGYNYRTITL